VAVMRRFFGRSLLSFVLQKVKIFFGILGCVVRGKKFFEKFFTSLSSLFTHVRPRVIYIHTLYVKEISLSLCFYT